ncbi:MAG: class I SAM-dependent methyltransferase [Elusimicrobia bacterium]|nr:class I SAM-dependent methyltransferase [Elusimicrobiota bacterium]
MISTDHPLRYSVHSRLREFHLRRLMSGRRGGILLDVGCGLGYLSETLGEGFTCVGLEADPESLALNKSRGLANMVRGSASRLPFKPDSIDAIICSEVLEHLPEGLDEEALRESCRVLKPGGRLYLTVPSLEGLRATTSLRNLGHETPGSGEYHYRMGYSWAAMSGMLGRIPGLRVADKTYSMFLASELFMDMVKWVYFRKNKLKEHSDLIGVKKSPLFRAYRRAFPLMHLFFVAEDLLLCRLFRGHILILALEKTGATSPGRS